MSKREALLVGKWICQEQTFVAPEDPDLNYSHIYLDDEYGVEFFPDFWCEVWAGRIQEEEGLLGDRLEYMVGLSIKWAKRNLGAENKNISLIGNYYA